MQDLNDFAWFVQVVDHGGFAAAGRALSQPKSKLSRRIAQLEARLGVRLIHRTTRHFYGDRRWADVLSALQSDAGRGGGGAGRGGDVTIRTARYGADRMPCYIIACARGSDAGAILWCVIRASMCSSRRPTDV